MHQLNLFIRFFQHKPRIQKGFNNSGLIIELLHQTHQFFAISHRQKLQNFFRKWVNSVIIDHQILTISSAINWLFQDFHASLIGRNCSFRTLKLMTFIQKENGFQSKRTTNNFLTHWNFYLPFFESKKSSLKNHTDKWCSV